VWYYLKGFDTDCLLGVQYKQFLDSERNDDCIDFTMMCVFFVSVIMVWSSKTASIFFNIILFDGKVSQVDAFGRLKFKIPNSFQKHQEKPHKN